MANEFKEAFEALRAIMKKHEARMVVVTDSPTEYYVNTPLIMKNKQPMFFGAVRIGKAYVSYHLMPVYCCRTLLDSMSPGLKARMQGKSCFNFKRPDAELFAELDVLTENGIAAFEKAGYF